MRWLVKTKAGRISLGLALSVGLLALIGWQLTRPKIGFATRAEIEAVLPSELLSMPKVDVPALERMDLIIRLAKGIDGPELQELILKDTNERRSVLLAGKLWTGKREQFKEIARILDQGSLQAKPTMGENYVAMFEVKQLAQGLAAIGRTYAFLGDFDIAQSALDLGCRLSNAMFQAGGSLIYHMESWVAITTCDASIRAVALLPSCPAVVVRHWLRRLPRTALGEPELAAALAVEFRDSILPFLENPGRLASYYTDGAHLDTYGVAVSIDENSQAKKLCGTLDPILTAQTSGRILSLDIKNAGVPLSQYDDAPNQMVAEESRGLPEDETGRLGPGPKYNWSKFKFRFLMDNTRNSLGRCEIANEGICSRGTIRNSCTWRARREATRVVLASVLYRRDHGGKLPPSLGDLVSGYLPSVPIDPFNGKLLLYSASQQKVWSVGENLIDDGGDIFKGSGTAKDVGVSLALTAK